MSPEELEANRRKAEATVEAMKRRMLERGEKLPDPVVPGGRTDNSLDVSSGNVEASCEGCMERFQAGVIYMEGAELFRARFCNACVVKEQERLKSEERREFERTQQEAWEKICPADYRATDLARLKSIMTAHRMTIKNAGSPDEDIAFERLFAVRAQGCGIGLIGPTGAGKTRTMFEIMRRFHFAGVGVRAINAVHFADELAATYEKGSGHAERWMQSIERAEILFIDDLGKERLTERVETTYYRVVENRKAAGLPIYFTANVTGRALIEKWQRSAQAAGFFSDRAEPIIRRLREMTLAVAIQ